MVGTMLSRLLPSKSKMASTIQSHEVLNEKFGYSRPQQIEISPSTRSEHLQTAEVTEPKPRITFDDCVRRPSATRPLAMTSPSRKHSYASVKEDPEIPQSFTSRRLLSEANPRLSDSLLRGPGFDTQIEQELTDCLDEEYEVAITDTDEDSESELVSSGASVISHDSILSATRKHPASLETMPEEILDIVFSLITLDTEKDRYADPKVDLFACLQVSKAIHAAALRVLYRHVKIPQSKAFFKFTNSLAQDSHLGELVQCLDFSHYSSIGFGRTKATHTAVPYLTPMTLKACLDRTKYLKAFLVHEHIDDELDLEVLTRLFKKPSMRAIDLCSCSSKSFTEAFTAFCTKMPLWFDVGSSAKFLTIERLSLHECTTLRPQVFEALLPRLARLTHLDVAHTMVDDKALMTIPTTARITHLNLERCTQLTGSTVVKFITQHPAVKDTIVYLNLMADASRYRLLSEDDLDDLLPALPQALRSLNLGGARVNSSHTRHLQALATHLEELGLKGASLSLSGDIVDILSLSPASTEAHPEWRSTLRYIDLTDVKAISKMSLTYSPTTIIGNESVPLEVIELGSSVLDDLNKSVKRQKNPEWIVRELGRRGWFVRQTSLLPKWLYTPDDGYRKWKMGARWWGMRKIPMYEQETGGMYGYFMFKRN